MCSLQLRAGWSFPLAADPSGDNGCSCARSNSLDEALDQFLLRGVVESFDDDIVDHHAGDADDLAAQFVAAATGRRFQKY